MKIDRDEMKTEAIKRMRILGIFPETIKHFKNLNRVSFSQPPFGAWFWASDELNEIIKKFEADYDALVYLAIRSYTTLGKMDALLFVGNDGTFWADESFPLGNAAYAKHNIRIIESTED